MAEGRGNMRQGWEGLEGFVGGLENIGRFVKWEFKWMKGIFDKSVIELRKVEKLD